LEDPNQTPLVAGADGQLTYSGADATLYQLALHEIGHALGLADSADPNSIMYYELGSGNQSLDATDLTNIASLYGNGGTAEAATNPSSASTTYSYADGDHTVSLTGSGDIVSFGTGADTLTITGGGDAVISGGPGDKTMSVDGSDNAVTLGAGNDTVSDSADGGGNIFSLTGGDANLMIVGIGDQVFLGGSSARVTEQASQMTVHVSSAKSVLEIVNFETKNAFQNLLYFELG
jgi:hypothetical protein